MIADKIFYADPQQHVIVTDSAFIVKNKEYSIPGIRNHVMKEVKPIPFHGLTFIAIGVFIALSGMFHSISFDFIPPVIVGNWTIGSYVWPIMFGTILFFWGLFMVATVKAQYALHISTAEGENDVIVSPQQEYVRQIIDALNRACMLLKK